MKATLPDGTMVEGTMQEVVDFILLQQAQRTPQQSLPKQVLALLPLTTSELIAALQLEPRKVYNVVYLLKRTGRIEKGINGRYYRKDQ